KSLTNRINRLVLIYLCLSLLTESTLFWLNYNKLGTLLVERLFTFIEFFFISWFFVLNWRIPVRTASLYMLSYLIIVMSVAFIINQDPVRGVRSVSFMLFVTLALFLFFRATPKDGKQVPLSPSIFWYNSAILYLFGTSLLLFAFDDFILHADPKL